MSRYFHVFNLHNKPCVDIKLYKVTKLVNGQVQGSLNPKLHVFSKTYPALLQDYVII